MKRENKIPDDLLAYLKEQREKKYRDYQFRELKIFCTLPVRAVKMKILKHEKTSYGECFRTVIIPAVDVHTSSKHLFLKKGYLKCNVLTYFVSGTSKPFPYGHVYSSSGAICLGSIFVPSAIPERSPALPLETLFLHNDRNLNHGNSHLLIDADQEKEIKEIISRNGIKLSEIGEMVQAHTDLIKNDEIWNLSADVAEQKPLPEALAIMSEIYDIMFEKTGEEREKLT